MLKFKLCFSYVCASDFQSGFSFITSCVLYSAEMELKYSDIYNKSLLKNFTAALSELSALLLFYVGLKSQPRKLFFLANFGALQNSFLPSAFGCE